jgi:hypothetical protein
MKRLVAASFVLVLAVAVEGCAAAPTPPESIARSDGARTAAVGGPMVNDRITMVTVTALVAKPRVDGIRAEIVYLGLAGTDPAGRNTARVRYQEYPIRDGVEGEKPDYSAVIDLDLARSKVLEFKGWRIQVIEATDAAIRYEVIGSPAR